MKHIFPPTYQTDKCYLVPISAALIPLVAGALQEYETKRMWATELDWQQGYNAFAELQVCMTKLCITELLKRHDQTYRLLDTSLNGMGYSVVGTDPDGQAIIEPTIPDVPAGGIGELPGLLARMDRIERLLDNTYNGVQSDGFANDRAIRTQLEDILVALHQSGGSNEDIIESLAQIIVLLA